MVVHDFDIECVAGLEPKADAPLIIDTDAELAIPVASQGLKPVVMAPADHQAGLHGLASATCAQQRPEC